MFDSILTTSSGTLSIVNALLCMTTSLLLGLLIAYVHTKTEHYTKNFIVTLALLPILVQVVIMMVNGNLGTSVAIMGAFALIRFRSMPATSREITSVFFSMAVGLSVGMGYLTFAITFTLIINLLFIIFGKTNFGEPNEKLRILKITIPEDLDYTEVFDDIFEKYTTTNKLFKVKTTNMGSLFELNYQISYKKDIKEKEFIDELRERNGNLSIMIHQEQVGISDL